jgi:hypothetical protein
MLQRGIDTPDMDVTWVSSLSLYFLALFGLNSVFRLILGDGNGKPGPPLNPSVPSGPNKIPHNTAADGTRDMQSMGALGGAAAGGGIAMPGAPAQDFKKLFAAERDNLDIVEHVWTGQDVEERLLRRFGKL